MLKSTASSERQDEAETRSEQSREESRAEWKAETRRRTDERQRRSRDEKPAEFCAMNANKREPEFAGGARSFIQSAQNDCAWRLLPRARWSSLLTPVIRAAHARACTQPLTRRTTSDRRVERAPLNEGAYTMSSVHVLSATFREFPPVRQRHRTAIDGHPDAPPLRDKNFDDTFGTLLNSLTAGTPYASCNR